MPKDRVHRLLPTRHLVVVLVSNHHEKMQMLLPVKYLIDPLRFD